jgi:hypothetical protein
MKFCNMSANDKHSVLLHFSGKYKPLYDEIRRKADNQQIPVSTYMRLLMQSNLEKEIVINKKKEETENPK